MMRLFLAIEIDDAIRENLRAVQTRLKSANADVRWVEPETMHLTVAFLGDQPDGQLGEIDASVAPVAGATAPFRFCLRGGSAFPRHGPLKTLWVGVGEGAESWKSLAQASIGALAPVGVPPGGDLVAHITLGRVKGDRERNALRTALDAEAQTDCGAQSADRLILVQSFLNPTGATYQELRSYPFAG